MIYLKRFIFPTADQERVFLYPPDLTPEEVKAGCFRDLTTSLHTGSYYPFNVLPNVGLARRVEFDTITIFYGGNGCGKTTALNIIAEKLHLKRDSLFNSGRFFSDYLDRCKYNESDFRRYGQFLNHYSRIITSDDVFSFSMEKRNFNKQLFRSEALKRKSPFLKERLEREEREHSNGETAMMYFIERMENEGLYLLDEPENSLSLENQMNLAQFIEASARGYDCQFIIATHSPIFLALPNAKIYDLDNGSKPAESWTKLEGVRLLHDFFKEHEAEFC